MSRYALSDPQCGLAPLLPGKHGDRGRTADDTLLFRRILDLGDTVVFEAERAADVQAAVQGAVDDELDICVETGENPDRPFSGRFNVRFRPDL